jgi:hypothetical protein
MTVPIYRFKFSESFAESVFYFSKVHQYDDRKVFKEEWKKWVEENEEEYKREVQRLKELGYDGDAEDKIYKSARYYYRKKSTIPSEPTTRRKYIPMSSSLIEQMDQHIFKQLTACCNKPADMYEDFCNEYMEEVSQELRMDDGKNIKKTYKNRYFLIVKKRREEREGLGSVISNIISLENTISENDDIIQV